MFKGLEELVKIIRERKSSSPNISYTKKLLNWKPKIKIEDSINDLCASLK